MIARPHGDEEGGGGDTLTSLCPLSPSMEQLSGGGVPEDSVLAVAGQPDGVQPRLPLLRRLEDHAKLQVPSGTFPGRSETLPLGAAADLAGLVNSGVTPLRRGYQQQDAHEFMRYLLDHLHLELQGSRSKAPGTALAHDGLQSSLAGKCCV